jgi:hypothetical protein
MSLIVMHRRTLGIEEDVHGVEWMGNCNPDDVVLKE